MAPKPLAEFPRPPHDNGRGVHWSARLYHPTGPDLQYWMNELKAMQIKWVKILDDGGGSSIELAQTLLANDMMPIVRIYRERPNPGHLSGREVDTVNRLIAAGVRYIETNNEPDLPAEWRDSHRPDDWLDIVVDNFIFDADLILDAGGLPALPAMGPGSQDNAIARVVERGRKDIFERGAWVAIHNYTLNHPLDYPDDAVNQEGQPLTPEEYAALAAWQYSDLSPEEAAAKGVSPEDYEKFQKWAWDGRTLEMVNELRAQAKNPGQTINDDANCFRAWEWWGNVIYENLGFYVPVISTEGGPVVGWGDDKRYAKVNPETQADWQLEIFRFLQDEAPEWYFSCCTWLIASKPLGDHSPTWDQMAWYTTAWDLQFGLNGQLPVVQKAKDTPSRLRHELRPPLSEQGRVQGTITDPNDEPLAGVLLSLRQNDQTITSTVSADDGTYELVAEPGVYDIYIEWFGYAAREITLDKGDTDVIQLKNADPPGDYEIWGQVRNTLHQPQVGIEVELRRNGITHATTTTDALGSFSFHPRLAGSYAVITSQGSTTVELSIEKPLATVDISVLAEVEHRYVLTTKRLLPPEETDNRRLFYGRVTDANDQGMQDIELEMRWVNADPGTNFPRTRTGHDPFKPAGYYEFLHSPGEFMISVVQGDFESDVAEGLITDKVPGREGEPITYEVNFQLQPVESEAPPRSIVYGSIPGGRIGQIVRLWRHGETRETELDSSRTFFFNELPAGIYDLELAGIGTIRSEIELDGQNQIEVKFPLLGAIVGETAQIDPAQNSVSLISESFGFTRHAELSQNGQYRFTNLPAGLYRIEIDDAILSGIECDGESVVQAPQLAGEVPQEPPQSPETGSITGLVHDPDDTPLPDLSLDLVQDDSVVASTTSDADGRFQFADVAAGTYAIRTADNILASDILFAPADSPLELDLTYTPPASPPDEEPAPTTGSITGFVHDPDNTPLPDLSLDLVQDDAVVASTTSDADGRFQFADVAAGTYAIRTADSMLASDILFTPADSPLELDLLYTPPSQPRGEEPTPAPQKILDHYHLIQLADPTLHPALLRLLATTLSQQGGSAGFSSEVAEVAARVSLWGDGISDETVAALQAAGCEITDHRQDILGLLSLLSSPHTDS